LQWVPEIIVEVSLKPDDVYALLANVIRLNPKLHILKGNERALTMRLVRLAEVGKPECPFGLAISYDGKSSSLHFTVANHENEEMLKDAVTEVVQMLVAYDASEKVSKLKSRDGTLTPL
jgi:hypothetical protein